jgi:tetratricopeptide (TPR) repeat protein
MKGETRATVLLTRLELFLRRERLKPLHVADRAKYSRQHFLRLRLGEEMPTERSVDAITEACAAESGKPVTREDLFERADLLGGKTMKLSAVHAPDLAVLDQLLEGVTPDTWAETVLASGIRSETAAAHLLRAGLNVLDVAPEAAAEVLRATMLLSAALDASPPELVASLSANALKGRANALRHLGRFDDALADLTLAGRLFATATYCAAETAQVEFTRAGVLFKRERWREALVAARTARTHFHAHGDRRRAAHAEIVEAGILFEQGETAGAAAIFHRLRPTFQALRDRHALALVWMNLAACAIRLGSEPEARTWLNRAGRAFRQSGNTTEFLRTRWSMGSYLARFRTPALGLRLLRRVERAFHHLGMDADSACVGLDVLELLIDIGAPNSELGAQAERVVTAFIASGMAVSMATALDHLRRIHLNPHPHVALKEVRSALRAAEDPPCPPVLIQVVGAEDAPGSDMRPQTR